MAWGVSSPGWRRRRRPSVDTMLLPRGVISAHPGDTNVSLTAHALHSLVTSDGRLKLSIDEAPVPVPGADEVVVRIDAAPLNPSDIINLLGAADIATLRAVGGPGGPAAEADVPKRAWPAWLGGSTTPFPQATKARASWCRPERPRKLCSGARWRSRLSGEATRLTES